MGFSSSKTKTKNEPWAPAQPYILKGMQAVSDVFGQNQPRLQAMSDVAQDGFMKMAGNAFDTANPYVRNAQAAAQNISNGAYLGSNPGQSTYDRLQNTSGTGRGGGFLGGGARSAQPGGDASIPTLAGLANGSFDPSVGMMMGMANNRSAGAGDATLSRLAQENGNPGDAYASASAGGQYLNAQPSSNLYSDMMSAGYLNGNPYLDSVIGATRDDVTKQANRLFAQRGMGNGMGSAFADVLSKNLASAEGQLRYQNYNDAAYRQLLAAAQSDAAWGGERGRMDSAAALLANNYNAGADRRLNAANALNQSSQQAQTQQLAAAQALGNRMDAGADRSLAAAQALGNQYNAAQGRALDAAKASDAARSEQVNQMLQSIGYTGGLREAEFAGINPAVSLLGAAASTPYVGTGAFIDQIRNATNGYGQSTTKTGMNLYQSWLDASSKAVSDRRLKKNIEKVGGFEDGLGIYEFDYIWGGPRHRGVMADEVEKLRPWALGPRTREGYATVDYGAL